MTLQGDRGGATQVFTMLVAAVVFVAAVAAVLLASNQAGGDRASPDAAAQALEAGGLADLLVGSPGVGWPAGADGISRLGIGASNGSGLQQSSIDALRGAMAASLANGKVDYPDAQRSLGIDPDGSQEFHIRIYPVGMNSVYDSSLSGLSVGYVADWTSLGTVYVPFTTPMGEMPAQANSQLNATMNPATASERQALRELGLGYTDRVYMAGSNPDVKVDFVAPVVDVPMLTYLGTTSLEGDVYPDNKQYLDNVLPGRLGGYDLLIVGSGVDHSTLTANAVKDAIRDWVLGGGTLVVLGSNSMAYQWLQPLFHAGVATVNGAATAPDVSHPVLKEPHPLSWTSYDSHGKGWDIKDSGSGAHYDDFTHVIVQGGEDVLAISKDGAFGDGRIFLTTYLPREVAATLGLAEAENFFENLVLFTDRAYLYLEYGATAPGDTPVAVAVRQSWLWDPLLGQVPVRIEVQTWG